MYLLKNIYTILLLVSLIVTFFVDYKKTNYFFIYILLGVCYEFIYIYFIEGIFYSRYGYEILSILYFGFFFNKSVSNSTIKKITLGVFLITLTILFFFLSKFSFKMYNQGLSLLICIYSIILALLYYIDMIIKPRDIPLRYEFPFWVSLGLLIWSILLIFNIGSIYYLNHTDPSFLKILQIGFYATNIVVYVIYLYGMISIWRLDNKKT